MVERVLDHLEEAHVRIDPEAAFGLGQVLGVEVHTGLGWAVFGTVDRGPVEETSFDLGVPLVQEGQPYVREVCLEEGTRHQDGFVALEAAEARELEHFQVEEGEEERLELDPESYTVTLEVNTQETELR
jgi:hypothetical protein